MNRFENIIQKTVIVIIIMMSVYLLFYSFSRSNQLSFTIDESYSYLHFMKLPVYKILLNDGPTANNHIVNTLLMKFSSIVLGEKEIWLRLHSNISHIFYLIFSGLLVWRLRNPFLKLAGFAILNLNPYMIDYFSLARGYGLTFVFILTSMFFFISFVNKGWNKYLIASYILAGLSVYSNFATIYYYSSLLLFSLIYFLIEGKEDIKNIKSILHIIIIKNKEIWIITLILILLSIIPILKLANHNEFYGHGKSGFWNNTMFSVLIASFYDESYKVIQPKTLLLFEEILSAIIFLTVVARIIKKGINSIKEPFVIFSILFFAAAGIEVLHHILTGSEFISMRGAIFFQILFSGMFIFWLDFLNNHSRKILQYFIGLVSVLIFIVTIIHFNKTKNFKSVFEWKFESNTKDVIEYLESEILDTNTKYKIGTNWLFESTINYYIKSREISYIEPVTREGFFSDEYDYFYASKASFSDDVVNNIKVVSYYPIPKTIFTDKFFTKKYYKNDYYIYSEISQVDSVFYIRGNLLGLYGLIEPEYNELTIESIYRMPGSKFYLELKAGRILSFNGTEVEGKTEPNPSCEYILEPRNYTENEYFIKSPTNEYLVLINDTLNLSSDTLMNRLIVNFKPESNHGI